MENQTCNGCQMNPPGRQTGQGPYGPTFAYCHDCERLGWVAHPRADDKSGINGELIAGRSEIELFGIVTDDDACYSYDDWALIKWRNNYYLLSTSGCSCPSPDETWGVAFGPATLEECAEHVLSGKHEGWGVLGRQRADFEKLIETARCAPSGGTQRG